MNDLQKSINITFFGDSICVGQGVSISNSWVAQLNNELKELYSEHKLIISNSSVNGRTSREALLDMPYHIQSQPIDILVVQFGLKIVTTGYQMVVSLELVCNHIFRT